MKAAKRLQKFKGDLEEVVDLEAEGEAPGLSIGDAVTGDVKKKKTKKALHKAKERKLVIASFKAGAMSLAGLSPAGKGGGTGTHIKAEASGKAATGIIETSDGAADQMVEGSAGGKDSPFPLDDTLEGMACGNKLTGVIFLVASSRALEHI